MLSEFSMDFFSLKGKTAIVTGGNTGLGQGYVVAFAKAGADLFVTTYDREWEETRKLVEAEGRKIHFFQADLTERAQVSAAVQECMKIYGKIDILVNNAGRSKVGLLMDMSMCLVSSILTKTMLQQEICGIFRKCRENLLKQKIFICHRKQKEMNIRSLQHFH